ncbi:sporulation integral membrane protein YlbJ [Brevibacillus daliensis]|uniref:sporulation integral membrane protein YlbJ n=1 Tax=Brevibacillus daliensis TaxID=2892995 RepID=UPI001E4273F8|nr:sporulation integral membrane protein YlbJ [Brevibacillus daliensis]
MSHRSPFLTISLAVCSILLVLVLIINPDPSFKAAVRGLGIWWEVVFPALLPFIFVSELLMGVGVVHFVGVLLEPLMRPLFNVPGTGGFVLTMGFSSGYPVAANLTTRLRERGNITQVEGERLVTFATTGDPLFVIGAVAVGFFHSDQLGYIIATTHYGSAILLGILYRMHQPKAPITTAYERSRHSLVYRALQAMHRARLRDNRPFGKLMGDAVQSALQTLMVVGGFIIMFSVLLQMLATVHITAVFNQVLLLLFGPFGFQEAMGNAGLAGLFEVTMGAQITSEITGMSMMAKGAIAAAIISWGGLSVHAQVASILSKTDIRMAPYLFGRFLHAGMAAGLTILCWEPLTLLTMNIPSSIPAFLLGDDLSSTNSWWQIFSQMSTIAISIAFFLLLLSYILSKTVKR